VAIVRSVVERRYASHFVEVYVNDVVALALILLLATSGYAAGRVHGQFGYRMGYRSGYRQGYFDGDRASWTRRRRDLQAAVASVLKSPYEVRPDSHPDHTVGTTYTSAARGDTEDEPLEVAGQSGRHARADRAGSKVAEPDMAEIGSDG
jgi:hypothetical protein